MDFRACALFFAALTAGTQTHAVSSHEIADEFEALTYLFTDTLTPATAEARLEAENWLSQQLRAPEPLRRLHAVLASRYIHGLAYRDFQSSLLTTAQTDREPLIRWSAAALLAARGQRSPDVVRTVKEDFTALAPLSQHSPQNWASLLSELHQALGASEFIPLLRSELAGMLGLRAHRDYLRIERSIREAQGWRTLMPEWGTGPRCAQFLTRTHLWSRR